MKYLLSLILLSTFGFVAAQDIPKQLLHEDKNDPEAKAILDKTKMLYESYKTMEADFTLEIEIPEEDVEVQQGKLIQSGKKFQLSLPDIQIYNDGTTVWTYMKNNRQVQISDAEDIEDSEDFITPNDILKMYDRGDFYYVLMNVAQEGNIQIKQIEFKPKDTDSEYSKMRLTINSKTNQIMRIKMFSKDGSRFTLKINDLATNKSYANSAFMLDTKSLPKEVSVEDLRI
jgi:outer membrane lipoprotein-sorting protein